VAEEEGGHFWVFCCHSLGSGVDFGV